MNRLSLLICIICCLLCLNTYAQTIDVVTDQEADLEFTSSCSCCDGHYSDFDFWVGEWNVFDQSGKQVGVNIIKKLIDQCVLEENWNGYSGNVGMSMNYFNSVDSLWHQNWVDNTGFILKLSGSLVDGVMIMKSELLEGRYQQYYNQISWEPQEDGTVLQKWEMYSKDDELLKTLFVGSYKRK